MTNLSNITITKESTKLSIMDGEFKMLLSEIVTADIEVVEIFGAGLPRTYYINSRSNFAMASLSLEILSLLEDGATYYIVSDYKEHIRILPIPVVSDNYKKLEAQFK